MSPKLRANVLWYLASKHLSVKADTPVVLAYTERELPYSISAALVHSLALFQLTYESAVETKEKQTCQGTLLQGYNLYSFLILII